MAPQLVVIATAVRRISSSHWRHWRPQSSPPAPAGKVQRHPSASDVTTKTHTTTTTTTTRALATSTAAVVVATVSSAASYYYGDGGNRHPEDTTTTITEDRLTATSASSVFLALWNRHFLTSVARTQCQEVATSAPTLKLSQPQKISSSISSKIQRKMTAIGHFAVTSETAWNPSIITFFMHLKGGPQQPPLTAKEFTALWLERQMPEKHPRFHQTVALSQKTGRRQFVEEDCTVQDHITDTVFPANRWDLRLRLQQMQLERWDLSDSLWHVTIAGKEAIQARWNLGMPFSSIGVFQERSKERENQRALKVPPAVSETMLLFRGHHALADGASIGAALSDLFDEAALLRDLTVQALTTMERRQRLRRRNFWQRLWRQWVRLVHFVVGTIQSLLYQGRLLWHQLVTDEDPWRQLQLLESADDKSGNSNDQNYARRTLSWSEVAPVDQVKWVAEILGRQSVKGQGERRKSTITVNDVFVSCITAALARQLDYHRQRLLQLPSGENNRPLPRQTHMNVAVPVHLKGGVILPDESVGNNIGAFVARVPGELDSSSLNNSSVDRLQTVSRELHAVKRTPTALISHYLAKCLSYASSTVLPLSWTSKLYAASNAGSLVVISNNRGSPVPVHLAGRRVESLYGFVPLPPGIPVGVVVMSYAGKVNCTVTAEQWAVPDGDEFMVWVLEEYLHLVEAAKTMQLQQQ